MSHEVNPSTAALSDEEDSFTSEERAEVERIFNESVTKNRDPITGLLFGGGDRQEMMLRVYRTAAARRVVDAREQREKEEKRIVELIQLPLFPYPEATRIVSNDMARSALFSATQGADREIYKKQLLATIDGIEIIFTGERLNQDDHDLLMQLVHFARHKPFGAEVTIPANAILAGLGLDKGKSQHDQLKARMERLLAPMIALRNTRKRITYYGHLIDKAIQDETKRHWIFKINPDLRPLYDTTSYSLVEWEQRRALKRKDLARWLQAFYATHADPFPLSVEFLHRTSGSAATIKVFRRALRVALDALVVVGFLTEWELDPKSDLVTVSRSHKGKEKQNAQLPNHISTHLDRLAQSNGK